MTTTAYTLKYGRFGHKAGTTVYLQMYHDYGLASDDTHATGIKHISVTLNADGGYPGFTVPVAHLVPKQDERAVIKAVEETK